MTWWVHQSPPLSPLYYNTMISYQVPGKAGCGDPPGHEGPDEPGDDAGHHQLQAREAEEAAAAPPPGDQPAEDQPLRAGLAGHRLVSHHHRARQQRPSGVRPQLQLPARPAAEQQHQHWRLSQASQHQR